MTNGSSQTFQHLVTAPLLMFIANDVHNIQQQRNIY